MNHDVELSVIVPVCELFDSSGDLAKAYLDELSQTGRQFELVYVLDGEHTDVLRGLNELAAGDARLRIVQLAKNFGEATALTAGFAYTSGATILTLPAYKQLENNEIRKVLAELEHCDIAVASRVQSAAAVSKFKSARRKAYHWLVGFASGESFRDIGCGVRAMKRDVADELPLYGSQFRFLPVLAARRGFRVHQVDVAETGSDRTEVKHRPRAYMARLLDIFALIFLTRFTKSPLRFFGAIGSSIFVLGAAFLSYIVIERLFFGVALADRPALLLTSLMVVLGVQVFALGLIAELIIYTHAKDLKEYTIEKIVN